MKSFLFSLAFSFVFLCTNAQNEGKSDTSKIANRVLLNKDEFKWKKAPESLPKGAMLAVLYGDPSKEGLFTVRLMLPANYKIQPHSHSSLENVSVLEGTYYVGIGEEFDETKAMKIDAGGFSAMPEKIPHFIFTKDKAIIQVSALGPLQINYVNKSGASENAK